MPWPIQVDDDVTDAPPHWDRTLLKAFKRLPEIGFLAADLEDDPKRKGEKRISLSLRTSESDPWIAQAGRLVPGATLQGSGQGHVVDIHAPDVEIAGFIIRREVEETPAFAEEGQHGEIPKAPIRSPSTSGRAAM